MALLPISVPKIPNVPSAAGIPSVLRSAGSLSNTVGLLVADARAIFSLFSDGPQWGIFDKKSKPVIGAQSVLELDYHREFRISDYPVEEGGFASYNKVATPFGARVVLSCGGSEDDRRRCMAEADYVVKSLELFTVVMPEFSYANANVVSVDFRRTSRNGLTLLKMDVVVQEVRIVQTGKLATPQDTSSATPVDGGVVQPTAAPAAAGAPAATSTTAQASAGTGSTTPASGSAYLQTKAELGNAPQANSAYLQTRAAGGSPAQANAAYLQTRAGG